RMPGASIADGERRARSHHAIGGGDPGSGSPEVDADPGHRAAPGRRLRIASPTDPLSDVSAWAATAVETAATHETNATGRSPPASSSSSAVRAGDAPETSCRMRRLRSRSLVLPGTTVTIRFEYVRPSLTIRAVEKLLRMSLVTVPAFSLVDPVSTSGPERTITA